jgi:hypothetical protein
MPSKYENLVAEFGEEYAKKHMAEVRAKRTQPGYFATLSKEELQNFQKKGVQKRGENKKTEESSQPS